MRLTTDACRVMYEFLIQLPPIRGWRCPPSQYVAFSIVRDPTCYGDYSPDPHTIRLSSKKIAHLDTALKTMAHEIVHLKLYKDKCANWDQHGPEFQALAHDVAKTMGWDHLEF